MISIKNVSFEPNEKTVLKNISLNIEKGKKYLILGPSGSGKTSLLKIINNLISPTEGKIFLDNISYDNIKAHNLRKRIGLIMQDPVLFGEYVYENFDLLKSVSFKNFSKEDVIFLLNLFGLNEEFYNKKNNELSGGEKYRISIIRTLLNEPDYILADEPFASLDRSLMIKIFQILSGYSEQNGITLIIVSHNYNDIIDFFDMLIFIFKGNIIFQGNSGEFLTASNKIIKNYLEGKIE